SRRSAAGRRMSDILCYRRVTAPTGPRSIGHQMSRPPVDPPPVLELPRVRCAPFHESLQVDPVGSAAHSDAFLCVEVPLPWERDIGMHEPFSSLVMKGGPLRWRPLGLVPTEGGRDHR